MATTLARFEWRRNTAATWTSSNETLLAGEPGYETDTGKWKLGNGTTGWTALPYQGGSATVRAYGATGDGTTDDSGAFRAALTVAAAAGTDRTVTIPAGTYSLKLASALAPAAGVTVRGAGAASTVLLVDAATAGTYTEVFNLNADDITLEGFTIRRASDFPAVLLPVRAANRATIRGVTLDGRRSSYPTNFCHGFQVGIAAATDLRITGSKLTDLSYGLFQTNAATATVDGVTVTDCTFTNNSATDLEFNAPNSTMTRIRVDRCNFTGNTATAAGGGFAVGFAHVTDAAVTGCTISGVYNNEAIHVEDWSSDISIVRNQILTGGRSQGSVIQMVTGANRIRIAQNTISTVGNTTSVFAVNALAGGSGTTPGGRAVVPPTFVDVDDNDIIIAGTTRGIYLEAVAQASITRNRMQGPGNVVSGTYGGPFSYAVSLYADSQVDISGNLFKGFTFGLAPRIDQIGTFGPGSTFTGNRFVSCLLGAALHNIGSMTATGNSFQNCQYPMILGHAGYATDSAVIVGNNAQGCTNPFSIYGTVKVTTTGTAAAATGVTVAVQALPNLIHTGTVLTFPSGTVTVTSVAAFQAATIVGTVTGTISAAQTAIGYLTYSTVGSRNRTITGNSDDYYGAAGYGHRTATTGTDYTVDGHEELILVTAAATVTLPPANRYSGQTFTVKNTSTGTVTVAAAGGTVETTTLATKATVRYLSDGTNWLAA